MAEVAFVTGAGAYLPLLALGVGAVSLMTRPKNSTLPKVQEKTQEQKLQEAHMKEMKANGASASFMQAMIQKRLLMGSQLTETEGLDTRGGGCPRNPNEDCLFDIFKTHAEMGTLDQVDTMHTIQSGANGEVRFTRRPAIVSTLTEELYDPKRPDVKTSFSADKHVPNYANHAQRRQAQSQIKQHADEAQPLRAHHGMTFFNRAPAQSFRYDEN